MNTLELLSKHSGTAKKSVDKHGDIRFMLVLPEKVRDDLRDLCEELNMTQIKFASALFEQALKEAINSYKTSKK